MFAERLLLAVYSLLFDVCVWCVLAPVMWARGLATTAGHAELLQRLGWAPHPRVQASPMPGPVLVHAVSVGEMNAAAPLVRELAQRGHRVLLTTGTAGGLVTARRLARDISHVDDCVYLPWDRRTIRRWLRVVAPAAVVVIETEIWPNLFVACADLDIPLVVANGRIRQSDVWKYRLARPFFSRVLASAFWIGAASARDREAYLAIGAAPDRVEVAGSLKFDAAAEADHVPPAAMMSASGRPLVVGGSTHAPEESWLLDSALLLAARGTPVRVILAPRDVGRADALLSEAHARGLNAVVWSAWSTDASAAWDVLVLDRIGVLRSCYAAADVVVMGGTFAAIGGHNILEPAVAARPILVGPHVNAIAELVTEFEKAGALMRVDGAEPAQALADACHGLLQDAAQARAMGERARALCQAGAGRAASYARAVDRAIRSRVRAGA